MLVRQVACLLQMPTVSERMISAKHEPAQAASSTHLMAGDTYARCWSTWVSLTGSKQLLIAHLTGGWGGAQGYDIMEEMYNQKTAAINFVQELCKTRSKATLHTIMSLAVQVMNEFQVGLVHSASLHVAFQGSCSILEGLQWSMPGMHQHGACTHGHNLHKCLWDIYHWGGLGLAATRIASWSSPYTIATSNAPANSSMQVSLPQHASCCLGKVLWRQQHAWHAAICLARRPD